jgi:proton-translocating NADH-quinone oxidoreductase chain N
MVNPSLLIGIPLAFAFSIPLFGLISKKIEKYVPILALLINVVISFILIPPVLEKPIVVFIGGWRPPFCINLVVGPLGIFLTLLISVIGLLVSIYAVSYIKEEPTQKYHMLFLLLMVGAIGIVLTGDVFNLFVFFEILCISSYALVAYNKDKEGTEAAMKYLIQGSVGSSFVLIGVALLYGLFGTLNMADIASRIASAEPTYLFVSLAFLFTGFGIEAAIFPLNAWLPDAHSSAPSSISAILSGIAIKTGVYGIARMIFTIFNADGILTLIGFLGLLTLLVGEMSAFRQDDIKRLLAYSSIGQIGLIVFALGIATSLGVFACLFQIVSHALAKALLFLAAGYMIYKVGSKSITSLNGIGKKMPLTSFAFAIGSFSLVGLPPFAGFISKFLIVYAAIQVEKPIFLAFIAVALIATVVEAGYFFKIVQNLYFKQGKNTERITETSGYILVPIILLVISIIVIGIHPQFITGLLKEAANELLERVGYIGWVLGGK